MGSKIAAGMPKEPPMAPRRPQSSQNGAQQNKNTQNMATPIVYFDMTIGGAPAGRIEMTLRADVVPKTAEVRRPSCGAA